MHASLAPQLAPETIADAARPRPHGSTTRARGTIGALAALVLLWSGVADAGVWTNDGPSSGNGTAVAIDPVTPTTRYVGTIGGGIFKSTDGGTSWHAVNTGLGNVAHWNVAALAIDPTAPARVYAAVSSGPIGGVFRTTNAGASWTFTSVGALTDIALAPGAPATLYAAGGDLYKSTDAGVSWTAVLAAGGFRSVTVDPSSPGTVYAGTNFGAIAKTTDGGASWSTQGGLASDRVDTLLVDPTAPNVVYAGLEDFGVYKSVDAGTTWTPIGPTVGAQKLSVQDLAIDPGAPGTVYAAGFLAGLTPSFGVYRSTDGGTSWSSTPLVALVRAIALDPANPSALIAATRDGIGIWQSADGGATWQVANTGLANLTIGALATAPSAPGTVYAGSAANGVFRSNDGGATWSPTGFTGELGLFHSLAVDPSTPQVAYLGTPFDGVYKTVDGGTSWTQLSSTLPALIASLVVDPSNPAVVYAGGFGGVARSANGGTSWTLVNNGLSPIVTALVIDPSAPGTLYAATDPLQGPFTGVYKTTDGGGQWSQVNDGLPAFAQMSVEALAIDPASPATLYAALEDGGVYKTTDGGASWNPAGAGITALDVTRLAVDAVVPGTVYAATSGGGVFTSTSGGTSWTATNVGLDSLSVQTLAVEAGRVYAGTAGRGVYVTDATTSPAQPIRGKSLVIQNPKGDDASRRKITVVASEPGSAATLDLDTLIANGATLTVTALGPDAGAEGRQVYSQTFPLPPPWTRTGTTGARYVDKTGAHGPVTSVQLTRSASGTMTLKATILGKRGPGAQPHVVVLPPDPGAEGEVRLEVSGGETYCAGFGGAAGGKIVNKGSRLFKVTNPTGAVCP